MKKIKLLLITMIAFILLILIGNYTYASTVNLKMVEERPESSQKYTVITPGGTEHTVFKILKADGTANEAFYCARASLGFGNSEYVNSANALNSLTYTESFNLKEQATSVMTKYRTEIGYNWNELSNNE